jgi:hypothetical protein
MSLFGGGGGGGGGSAPNTTTQYIREAPGIEERKIGLMDTAAELAKTPVNIPTIQTQGLGALEQQGITQSGITGVGANTLNAGIGSVLGAQGAAALDPTSAQFQNYFNPYQSFITDEINRQAQMQQNQIGQNAVMGGAFGGGREGVQRAELGGRTLSAIGQAQGTAFQNALNAFQNNQSLQAQTGLQAGSQLAQMGQAQQGMAQQDINQLMAAGDAQRQTELQRAYEPYQRMEFVKNMYAAGPTTQSAITQTTSPGTNPLAQAAGAGLGAYATYSALNRAPAVQNAATNAGR